MLFIIACLGAAGTFAVYEATSGTRLDGLHVGNMVMFGFFFIPMLLVAWLDYRFLTGKIAYVLYAIGIGLLVLVQATGEDINGAVRWFRIGSIQVQPSEMVKIFTIMLVAHLLQKRQGEKLRFARDILPVCAVIVLPFLLIMKQPDLGTALVFVGIGMGMIWMGNVRAAYMAAFLGAIAGAIGLVLKLYHSNYELLAKFVKPHQMARIQTFLDPTSDPDKAWHVQNAMTAIGSGRMYGDDGIFLKQGFIPYLYSDSIFVVIGEKFGFVGAAVLLMLYYVLFYRMIIIIGESRDLAGAYLVVGLVSMMVFQVFVNIGMHIGMLPLTGISLPFISYGGSSLLTNMIAIGLALSVKTHRHSIVVS